MMEEDHQIVRFKNTFPPGFRFHPSDEELIVHYLKKKINSNPLPAPIVADIDLYKFNPWDLPGLLRSSLFTITSSKQLINVSKYNDFIYFL